MNESTALSLEDERALINNELERLCVLQDRPTSAKNRVIIVDELLKSGIPAGSILQGIKSLIAEDLHTIKLPTLLAAARKFVEQPQDDGQGCADCVNGFAILRDKDHKEFALACRCSWGQLIASAQQLTQWNGEASQTCRNRLLLRG